MTAPEHPDRAAVKFSTSDSRFNPFTLAFELTGGQGQYGLTFDDYGRRFTCSNRHPVMHVVLEPRYLKRNPHLAFSETVQEVSAVGAQAVVWPISADMTTASFHPSLMSTPHAGTFTAASGVHIHRGDALPERSPRQHLHLRIGAEPGAEADPIAERRHLHVPAGAERPRVPGLARPVVPAGVRRERSRWRALHRGHVPQDHRPPAVRAGSRAVRCWISKRGKDEAGSIGSSPALEGRRQDRSTWGGWARANCRGRSNIRMPGGAKRPSVCSWSAAIEARSRFFARSPKQSRSEVARIHALWTLEGLGGLETADIVRGSAGSARGRARECRPPGGSAAGSVSGSALPAASSGDDPDDRVRFQRCACPRGNGRSACRWTRSPRSRAATARSPGCAPQSSAPSEIGRTSSFAPSWHQPAASNAVRAAVMQDLGQLFGAGQTPNAAST